MTDEEKKAIEYWKNYMDILHWNTQLASEHHMSVLLNLIEKQSKMIDLMSEKLTSPINGKEWVIKHYEDRVENEKNEKNV